MKRLLLTSDGLSSRKIKKEFLKLLDKPVNESKVLVIYSQKKFKRKYLNILLSPGLSKKNIFYANISKKINPSRFKNIDVLYSCGGNTFYILDRIRKTKFDIYIKSFISRGKLYVGISAGSIIVHKTIETAGWGSEPDKNLIGLSNLKGLSITNISIFPHFKKKLKKEIDLFKRNAPYPILALKDGQALKIVGNRSKLIK